VNKFGEIFKNCLKNTSLGAIFFEFSINSFNLFGCNFAPVLQIEKGLAMNIGFSETNFSPTMPQ
jgi:hypothetical protein